MRIIVGGHFQAAPEGWTALSYEDQDITQQLKWEENSIDCLFSEHILEHLPFEGAISYFKEAKRVLKEGGVLRTVCPTVDKLIKFKNDELGQFYCEFQTKPYYPNEDRLLKEIGLSGVNEDPIVFMLDSLFKGHHHKLLWTSNLIKKVLITLGFSEVYIHDVGETNFNQEYCLERTVRGLHPDHLVKTGTTKYDCESMVIEAKK